MDKSKDIRNGKDAKEFLANWAKDMESRGRTEDLSTNDKLRKWVDKNYEEDGIS